MTEQCFRQATYRYTWPGNDESFICLEHEPNLRSLAEAMGLSLPIIKLAGDTYHHCQQQVTVTANKI